MAAILLKVSQHEIQGVPATPLPLAVPVPAHGDRLSRYVVGQEPPCPTQSPFCAGVLYRRESKECAACRRYTMHRNDSPKAAMFAGCDSSTEVGDTRTITKGTDEQVRTLDDLIRVCQIDTEEWTIERWTANKWEMGSVDRKSGTTRTTPLYQIKAVLVRRVVHLAAREEVAELIEFAKSRIVATPSRIITRDDPATMIEIDIFDLHAGKMAWAKETGHENYDSKIAVNLYQEALETLIARIDMRNGVHHFLLVTGNDLLNADNSAGTTTHGTPQDSDLRFQKTFAMVRETIIHGIERLRSIAPVIVPMIPGNHDTLAVWHLGDSLECYFHKHSDVRIINAPTLRKYHRFGDVMLMHTHGDKGKHPDYPLLMATEQPKMFGATKFREAHVGHHHESKVREYHGVRVRTLSALTAADAWHAENQYVGNQRAAEAFVWHQTEGLIGTAIYTAPSELKEAA